ncbi:MAG: MltA domain-containing protein [Parvularculaceae bacterium]|nr:MltA domain-containing protein [Parvularculaceae bacterium]
MEFLKERNIAAALAAAVIIAIGLAALTFSGVIGRRAQPMGEDYVLAGLSYRLVQISDLAGWRLDDAAETLPVFLRSCARMKKLDDDAPANPSENLGPGSPAATLAGRVGDWRAACAAAAEISAQRYADDNARTSAARSFYEFHFRPIRILERRAPAVGGGGEKLAAEGRFTGYFEPFYQASPIRTAEFSAALYARPDDLVTVDLGRFRPEFAGQRIAGRVVDGALNPYPDHAAINAGALAGRARILAFMRPTDLLFLQIQGSGRLALAGRELRVGYDGANGRPYTAIGRTLIENGALDRNSVSMQTIRAWLDAAPDDAARKVRESNESFVFFRILESLPEPSLGPLGAEGVQLTPGRSLAVDPRFTPFGAPVWIDIPGDEKSGNDPVRRLLIAQDAGGAIKGPIRGDIFVGSGPKAGEVAGGFNEIGAMYTLLPTAVAERLAAPRRS